MSKDHDHGHGGHHHHSQNFIRRLDLFGHTMSLNFDVFEYKRKTMFGGVMSVVLGILGCILLSIQVNKLMGSNELTVQKIIG